MGYQFETTLRRKSMVVWRGEFWPSTYHKKTTGLLISKFNDRTDKMLIG